MPEIQNPKFQIPNLTWNLELETWNPREARFAQARIIHRFASRSGGSAGGTRRRDRDPRRRTLAVRRGGRGSATQSRRM